MRARRCAECPDLLAHFILLLIAPKEVSQWQGESQKGWATIGCLQSEQHRTLMVFGPIDEAGRAAGRKGIGMSRISGCSAWVWRLSSAILVSAILVPRRVRPR
jgi:hypothetical protein